MKRPDVPASKAKPTPDIVRTLPSVAVWLCLLAVFLVDYALDPALVDGSLYVIPVVMTLWVATMRATLIVTVTAVVLAAATLASDIGRGGDAGQELRRYLLEIAPVLAAALAVFARKRGEANAAQRFREWRDLANASPILLRAAGVDGRIIYTNRTWQELTGLPREQLLDERMEEVAIEGRAELARALDNSARTRKAAEAEYRLRSNAHEPVWIIERVTPRADATGKLLGFIGSGIDVTKRHAALRSLSDNRQRLAEAEQVAQLGNVEYVGATQEAIWSDGFYRLLGVEPGTVWPSTGGFLSFVVPEERASLAAAFRESAGSGMWPDREVRIIRADGTPRVLKVCARIVRGAGSEPERVFATLQDITDLSTMEQSLIEHRNSLAKAQQIANLGSWSVEIASGKQSWSEQMLRLFGLPLSAIPPTVEEFVHTLVHADDREMFMREWTEAVQQRRAATNEYRILRRDGSIGVIRAQCEFVRGPSGRFERIIGTCQDVTEMRSAEAALRTSEERFNLAARGANDGIWDWPDVKGDALWISSRYYELLGYVEGEIDPCGKTFNESLVHPDDVERNLDAVARHLEAQEPYDVEIRLRHKSGEYRWFRMRGQATYDGSGKPVRMAGSTQDVHARKEVERRLEEYQEQLRSLAYGAALAAERERRRIGVELHDRTIQNLGLMRVKLAQLREGIDLNGTTLLFDDIYDLVKATIRDTRALLSEISPPVLYELGFEAAVEWLADQVGTGPGGPPCTVHSDGLPKPLGESAQVVLFQAARELLANVGKHAHATQATISVLRDGNALCVQVSDDGVGFDPSNVQPPNVERGGFGLFSIRERLRLLGGAMAIDSAPGRGTRVRLTAPLETQNAASRLDS